jgi:hypothetical protein
VESEKRQLQSATFWSSQSSKRFVRGASQSTRSRLPAKLSPPVLSAGVGGSCAAGCLRETFGLAGAFLVVFSFGMATTTRDARGRCGDVEVRGEALKINMPKSETEFHPKNENQKWNENWAFHENQPWRSFFALWLFWGLFLS